MITRRAARAAALEKARCSVFGAPELLEHILKYLPPKQLFVVQRASREWKAGIDSSPTLKWRMFKQPTGEASEIWTLNRESEEFELQRNTTPLPGTPMESQRLLYTLVALNPFLDISKSYMGVERRHLEGRLEVVRLPYGVSYSSLSRSCSFMSTYLYDPPLRSINVLL